MRRLLCRLAFITLATSAHACAGSSSDVRPDGIRSTSGVPPLQGAASETPTPAETRSTSCDDFGSLSAAALTGTLQTADGTLYQQTTMTVPQRPTATRVRILAAGAPSELLGREAVLGVGVNASYATCTHCMIVAIGCTTPDCSEGAWFFPRGGTAALTAVATAPGQTFSGSFHDVELEQVVVAPETYETTPVPGGRCVRIAELAFAATVDDDSQGGAPSLGGATEDGGIDLGAADADAGASGSGTTNANGSPPRGPGGGGTGTASDSGAPAQ